MLSDTPETITALQEHLSLNAPYGARCFLTRRNPFDYLTIQCLNAPYGARCFLTKNGATMEDMQAAMVLMHLMALGAF